MAAASQVETPIDRLAQEGGGGLEKLIVDALEAGAESKPIVSQVPAQPTPIPPPPTDSPVPAKTPKPPKKEPRPSPLPGVPDEVFEPGQPAPPAPPAPAPDAEPVKEPVPEAIKTAAARENFERVSEKLFQTEKREREVQKKLSKAEEQLKAGDPNAAARIKELEGQLGQLQNVAQFVSLEYDPNFQREYVVPRRQTIESTRKAITDAGGDPAILEAALALNGAARTQKMDEVLEGISSNFVRRRVETAIDYLDRLDAYGDSVKAQRTEYLKKSNEQMAAGRHQWLEQHAKTMNGYLAEAIPYLRDQHGWAVLKKFDDPAYKEWNDKVDQTIANAKRVLIDTDNPKEIAVAAVLAASAPMWKAIAMEEHAMRMKAEGKNKAREESEPGLTPKKTRVTTSEREPTSSLERAVLRGFGVPEDEM
jgi:hypothetical protein